MLTKARPLRQTGGRILVATVGDTQIKLGVLPLAQFLNGHTYFVQHAHTLPGAAPPLSVHMTYQFAEGAKFAYGQRESNPRNLLAPRARAADQKVDSSRPAAGTASGSGCARRGCGWWTPRATSTAGTSP